MVSDDQAAADQLFAENADSHLLKLPPELRKDIYELVLALEDTCVISGTSKPRKPALLQVCRQLRNESRLVYYELNTFHAVLDILDVDSVRRWAANITPDELRKIKVISFDFQVVLCIPARDFFDPRAFAYDEDFISTYEEVVANMLHRGLATSAVRVFDFFKTRFTVDGFLFDDTEPTQGCLIYGSSEDEEMLPDVIF